MEADVKRMANPVVGPLHLHTAGGVVVAEEHDDGEDEANRRDEDGELPGVPGPVLGQEHGQGGPGQRHEDEEQQRYLGRN